MESAGPEEVAREFERQARALFDRAVTAQSRIDLDEALEVSSRAWRVLPEGHSSRAWYLVKDAWMHRAAFEATGDQAYIVAARTLIASSEPGIEDDTDEFALVMHVLAAEVHEVDANFGPRGGAGLQRAREHAERALELAGNYPVHLAGTRAVLARVLTSIVNRNWDPVAAQQAIRLSTLAVDGAEASNPDFPVMIVAHAQALSVTARRMRDAALMARAVRAYERALDLQPPGGRRWQETLALLIDHLHVLLILGGDRPPRFDEHLDAARELLRTAKSPDGTGVHLSALRNTVTLISQLSSLAGSPDAATPDYQITVNSSFDTRHEVQAAIRRADALVARFVRIGQIADVRAAEQLYQAARATLDPQDELHREVALKLAAAATLQRLTDTEDDLTLEFWRGDEARAILGAESAGKTIAALQSEDADALGETVAELMARQQREPPLSRYLPHLDFDRARVQATRTETPEDYAEAIELGRRLVASMPPRPTGVDLLRGELFENLADLLSRQIVTEMRADIDAHRAAVQRQLELMEEGRFTEAFGFQTEAELDGFIGRLLSGDATALNAVFAEHALTRVDERHIEIAELRVRALELHARTISVQSGTAHALEAARAVEGKAIAAADECVTARRPELALRALELGRAAILGAVTNTIDTAARLEEAGHLDLARRWREEAGSADTESSPRVAPSDLRLAAIEALGELSLNVPTAGQIAIALEALELDLAVYLLPRALLSVNRAAEVRVLECPGYAAVLASVNRFRILRSTVASKVARSVILAQVLDAAWPAVADALLSLADTRSALPAVALIPTGAASAIPWHAARAADPARRGGYRYLLEDVALTYATSGKALISAAGRPIATDGEAIIVADTTGDLPDAQVEAAVLADEYLHGAQRHLGPVSDSTPDTLMRACRAEPTVATVLHLACHALAGSTLGKAQVLLARGRRLQISDLIDQARRLPAAAPGPLTVMSACDTASAVVVADESLSLANAFLAGGSAATVSTLWPIDGRWTASVMISFYEALRARGMPPVLALRHAQLEAAQGGTSHVKAAKAYMSAAQQLGLSHSVPEGLSGPVDPLDWAAFVHHGQTKAGRIT